MERKYHSYIKEWRKHRGLTQEKLLARVAEIVGDQRPDDATLAVPMTAASLSRIENGRQNFNMATLAAFAEALNVSEPGWLLDRNPLKTGEVVLLFDRLNDVQRRQAAAVIEAMFAAS